MDRSSGLRSLQAVRKRGRWPSSKSVKRYDMFGLLDEAWRGLGSAAQAHCEASLRLLPDVLLCRARGFAPPQQALAVGQTR